MDIHRRVVSGLDEPLLLLDQQGRVRFCNTPAIRLLGRDLGGIDLMEGSFLDDLPIVQAVASRCRAALAEDAAPAGGELFPVQGDQGPRLFWMRMSGPGADGDPEPEDRVVLLMDVTELLHSAATVRTVFSQVNHDLRSPLTSIGGAAELLKSGRVGQLEGMQKRLVGIIDESAQKIAEILARTKADIAQRQTQATGETT